MSTSFAPATYLILNFEVEDIDGTVDALSERGVRFERAAPADDLRRTPGQSVAAVRSLGGLHEQWLRQKRRAGRPDHAIGVFMSVWISAGVSARL